MSNQIYDNKINIKMSDNENKFSKKWAFFVLYLHIIT
jgi:hypothetical protein